MLLATALLLLQTTAVQTYVAGKVADSLSGAAIDARITFGKIHFKPFNTLIIRDLNVIDSKPDTTGGRDAVDTLFTSGYIVARFTLKGLTGESIDIASASVRDATFNLVLEEGDFTTNLTRMFRIPADRIRKGPKDKEIFHIRNVELAGTRFTMKNHTSRRHGTGEAGIDWNDLDVSDIKVKGRHLRLTGKIMSGELDELSFKEKSGYSVKSISGRTRTGQGVALIEDIRLKDSWSNIDIPYFTMQYETDDDFAEFISKVKMNGIIRPSSVSMNTIGYFAPALKGNTADISISGGFSGTVSDLAFNDLVFSTEGGKVSGKLSGRLSGLPDTEKMAASLKMQEISFTTSSLNGLIERWTGSPVDNLDSYAPGERFRLYGNLSGRLDNMSIKGSVYSGIGRLRADIDLKGIAAGNREKSISGILMTKDLDLGKAAGNLPVHQCSMEAAFKATLDKENPSLAIDSLKIDRLNFNGYDYSGIAATGTLSGRQFNGKVICNDPNLSFMFQGIFSFSGKTSNALYRFYANIGYADLYALNLDRRGRSMLSLQTNANFTRTAKGDMLGNVDVADIILENAHGRYDIGDIRLSSFTGNGRYRIRLTSGFADGAYSGTAPLTSFFRDLGGTTIKREVPSLFSQTAESHSGNSYEFSFRTMDTMGLLAFLAPGMYIEEDSSVKVTIDADGRFNGYVRSGRIAMKEQYIKDIDFTINNSDNVLAGEMKSESIYVATVMMKNNSLKMFADDNHVGIEFSYDNQDILENRGEVVITGDVSMPEEGRPVFDVRFLPSSVYLNSREWNIYPSEIHIDGKDLEVKNIEFRSGEQSILAEGGFSQNRADTLDVRLDRFDISIANPLIGEHFGLEGAVSGLARITSPSQDRGVLMDLLCHSASIGGERIGDIYVRSGWNSAYRRFDISAENDLDGRRSLSVAGSYTPSRKYADIYADLDMLDLGYAAPFLEGIFSDAGGSVSGKFTAEGPLDNISVRSEGARLNDAELTIAYTNVGYIADGPFHIDESGIYFDNVTIRDRYDNPGRITGMIGYDHFRDMYFDIGIEVDRIEAVNLEETESSVFYGHLFATGRISVSGPVHSIQLSAEAATARNGELHIPIASSLTAGSTNLLKFKEPVSETEVDPYEQMMTRFRKQEKISENFSMKLSVSTTPEVEAFVEIDKASGNVLRGRGTGNIELVIRPSDQTFNISGDYTIISGNYHFVALGIAARDFTINDGSTIRFNGDIMDSNLNIGATYSTKASLSTLIADESSVDNRRTVNCGIQITDKLSNPRLAFSIDIPDINPTVKARVESALSSEDKIQKQFLSLLISNSFLPDEQSGIVNNSSVLFSNVTEIMTNQLNTIFQKLDIPLDLGFNYQQSEQGNDIFDVAVSTQLFNNRVIVNGNIGNKESTSGSSTSDVVGDLDIEIKLDRPGAFRLNLFSLSADQYTNYLDNSQRNGIGIAYQQEFNNFGQFVKRMFMGKKKREEAELEDARKAINEKKNHIKIEAGGNESRTGKDRRRE